MPNEENNSKPVCAPLRPLSLSLAEILQSLSYCVPYTHEAVPAIIKQQQSDRLTVPKEWIGKQILCLVLSDQQADQIKRIDSSRNQ